MPVIGSTAPNKFKQLSDTPEDYAGQTGKFAAVNSSEDGLDFQTPPSDVSNVLLTNVGCNTDVYVGSVVRLDSLGVAQNAVADSITNSNMVGICETKPTSILCNIRVLGTTDGIFTGLDPSQEYFLSPTVAGGISLVVPSASGDVVLKIGQPFSSTRMIVLKGQRSVRS